MYQKIVGLFIILLLGGIIGFYLGNNKSIPSSSPATYSQPTTASNGFNTIPFFDIQSASINNGTVIANDKKTLTIKNSQNKTAQFPVAGSITIVSGQQRSTDISTIQFNKNATIGFAVESGQYQVASIIYNTQNPITPIPTTK